MARIQIRVLREDRRRAAADRVTLAAELDESVVRAQVRDRPTQ